MKKNNYDFFSKGQGLITFIIIIAIIIIASFLIVEYIFNPKEAFLKKEAGKEIGELYFAVIGDGEEVFGYHGDMGVLPRQLADLVVQGGQPNTSEYPAGTGQIIGWKGPYLSPKRWDGANILDPYGNPYVSQITSSDGNYYWQLLSRGKDGVLGSSDDITTRDPILVSQSGADYYIPSSVYTSISIGRHISVENNRFVVYYPVYGDGTSYANPVGSVVISNIPVGKRAVRAYVYMKLSDSCDYHTYKPYDYKIVAFPLEHPGKADFRWQGDAEELTDASTCYRLWWFWIIEPKVRSSLTWDPPGCTASQNGVTMKLVTSSTYQLNFNSSTGYFEKKIHFTGQTYPHPPYFVSSNSGKSIYICQ